MVENNPSVPVCSGMHGFFAPPNGGLAVEGKKWEMQVWPKDTEMFNE